MSLASKVDVLRDRAHMLARARAFFTERGVLEVDVPILSQRASVDAHIDLIEAEVLGQRAFLHSSPEYGMKRLLAEGVGDIFQLSHVFRADERGERHNPEFTMVEWYRCGMTFDQMIEETRAFIQLFLDVPEFSQSSYVEVFGGDYPSNPEQRDHRFAFEIEPTLKAHVLKGFPSEQAALAQINSDGLAERFEIFVDGVELANGYHELIDPVEQKERLEEANRLRAHPLPMDTNFLEALEQGLPDCCGVAVGFDRLMMLRHQARIDQVIPFAWEES